MTDYRPWTRFAGLLAAAGLLLGLLVATGPAPAEQTATRAADPDERARPAPARKSPRGFKQATIITIKGEINDLMFKSLERRVEKAKESGSRLIVFELDTPGGAVNSALDICNLIKRLPDEIHSVAWVNPSAYSAGSMIALACKEIIVSPASKIGDCQPIMIGPQGVQALPDDVEAKLSAPILTEFRDSARERGYDQLMCVAMIQPEIEVFWIENTKTGERLFASRALRDEKFGIDATKAPQTTVKEKVTKHEVDGEPIERREREIVAEGGRHVQQLVKSQTDWDYVKASDRLGKIVNPIVAAGELLTMTQDEALAYGFAAAEIANERQLIEYYDIDIVDRAELTWSEELVNWLTSPLVRGILMVLVMLGAYVEFHTPGVGLPGLVALICLVVFLGAPYITGLANVWEIMLVILGVILLGVELFVLPGFGIAGIAGIILILVGLIATFVPEDPTRMPWTLPRFDHGTTVRGIGTGLKVMGSAIAASLVGAVVLSRFFPKVPYVGRIVAPNPTPAEVAMPEAYPRSAFLGELGKAVGPLRPAGKAVFGDTLVDVVSQSDYIDAGEPVEVIERRGNRIVVRRVRDA
ncbi:MAG: ATP-dependent Clp protease proteolytic subunit [Phycisphaerae bacterium]|nr:ATP-dependent Clp protease proteolytic subunit [Phycisphaerae bacterium]